MNPKNSVPSGPTLVRGITRVHLIGLLINTIIGAGILGLPSKSFALVGSYSVATWLLCACVVLLIALCLAEVSTRFRDSGGPYLYAWFPSSCCWWAAACYSTGPQGKDPCCLHLDG
jgi:hypothetical protein